MTDRAETILSRTDDLICGFLYYDRKEDEDLGPDEIQTAIREGEITTDQITAAFRKALLDGLKE